MDPRGTTTTPKLECDLLMKGGITSGVIYPLAIRELAREYRLRRIGGASAGAIAAVAAAAAEYGRATGGFEKLAELPVLVSQEDPVTKQSKLLSLFEPTEEARPLFALLVQGLAKKKLPIGALLSTLLDEAPGTWGLAAGLTALIAITVHKSGGGPAWVGAVAAGLVLFAGAALFSAFHLLTHLNRVLSPAHGYGLCDGKALTAWLAAQIDRIAGREVNAKTRPLTVGDLAEKGITIETMTTSLTHGRPYRLPLKGYRRFFFKRSDLNALFPPRVVEAIEEAAIPDLPSTDEDEPAAHGLKFDPGNDYVPFPRAEDLPVVVAARLSLSFPVLLQAVPLYAVDWSIDRRRAEPVVERCWFSDGGICSNLPIHFFDALLPTRPTFALNLKPPHRDHPVDPLDPKKSVWVPESNRAGMNEAWNRFDGGDSAVPIFGFLGALIDTMQSWNDNLSAKQPGYRDRIAHISHTSDEGGLNLAMPKQTIESLAARGEAAGDKLVERFVNGGAWQNHLWVRYRSMLSMLGEQVPSLEQVEALTTLYANPPSYRLSAKGRAAIAPINVALLELRKAFDANREALEGESTPQPFPELKPRARM